MISIDLIRNSPELVRDAMRRRNSDVSIDRIVELDARRRSILVEEEGLRARRNEVSRALGQTKERPPGLLEEMRGVGAKIKDMEAERRQVEEETDSLLLTLYVVSFRKQVCVRVSLNKLGCDSYILAILAYRAFENMGNVEFLCNV